MGKVPSNFHSILIPDAMVVDNSESLDRLCEEYLKNKPRPRLGSYNAQDGSNPWTSAGPLMTPTMNSKAENATALQKSALFGSMAKAGAISAGGTSHAKVVLDLIEKILVTARPLR